MKIIPAILANDINRFKKYLQICVDLGVDEIQIDIADGKFVNNTTVSISEIMQELKNFKFKLQFHLMVKDVTQHLEELKQINFEIIYIHFEALDKNYDFSNKKIGLAINPETQIEKIEKYLKYINSVLIMTVEPGFYGGKFLTENLEKIKDLKKLNFNGTIGIDGGINNETFKKAIKYQPDFVCSGSYLLNDENPKEIFDEYRKIISKS
ncbi:hypothetical protein COY43_02325 [Candidatus Berkelbacteria bacterium CG_4_10_14_0_8_um_filter_35_9_33_8]|uniref:Ribulose-phosphate 3-epimerase n=1 Tax=Candidatus Berkelbacteria bacterium CG_4_10_14_0_2_um_filter_35_9_33_12 TaxID=1974499 RepID=A0A2M7W4B3_9BACT|nr:MAG: hypothetical protein COX10_01375 [Candidatus Berkelbacteria bacterium CG23_combo_of_CG06-09_8_20_14_all_33_15]PIS08327.1 MAG: hypothetical protein COT76_02055 [Candidatus Berkelbacteria bacterium CG10_big_fil_rev_8_21_14_0_10_33_10]PIZ28102.1 MAG: hypothetical protein COY43_02325 [Candidatus Berkelbacteria bacterium CG_4_10_14_0_8_um_filter_35_9_33_8]PJA20496.1 MAG: hypothetical protein COX60_01390 [Candidatus Berkelbacteria bacterium CG_4_10_14_0_2_um_filter_35_9_33_12]